MTDEVKFTDRLKRFKQKYFPERQLFLRSEGRVRFVTFGSYTQMSITAALMVAVGWAATATVGYITRDAMLQEKDQHIANISDRYQTLSGDFSVLEEEIEKRAKQLEARQKLIEEIAGVEETTNTVNKGEDTKDQKPSSSNMFLIQPVSVDPAVKAPKLDPLEANKIRRQALLKRLDQVENRQRQTMHQMIDNINDHLKRIDTILAKTKIGHSDLLKYADKSTIAQGGPFERDPSIDLFKATNDDKLFTKLLDTYAKAERVKTIMESLPVGEPAEKYYISSKYGRRIDPLRKTWSTHRALDMAGWPGTKILAATGGKVIKATQYWPYGKMIEIDHGNGFRTRYGHMRKLRVKMGQQVTAGQHIGDMGDTGRVTSTHLHYEVWYNKDVIDPLPFLKAAKNVRKIKQESTVQHSGS